MNWKSLAKVLVELFRPLVRKWLDDLLAKVANDAITTLPLNPSLAISDVFAAARAEVLATHWLPWIARRKLLVLDTCQRTALARGHEVCDAAAGLRAQPVLTTAEKGDFLGL